MFAKLPAPLRHLLLLLLSGTLTYLLDLIPDLNLPSSILPVITLLITALLAWVTPLVQSYGLGQAPADASKDDDLVAATDNSSRPEDGFQTLEQDPKVVYDEEGGVV